MKALAINLFRTLAAVILVFSFVTEHAHAQQLKEPVSAAVEARIGGLELNDQDVLDGVSKLSQSTGLAYAIELPLRRKFSDVAAPLTRFSVKLDEGTVADVMDKLCELDPTFIWKNIGNTVNVFPRAVQNDPGYFVNRTINVLKFNGDRDASNAVMTAAYQLPGAKAPVAVMVTGVPVAFSEAWNETFANVTMREALDRIAARLGPTHGWQLSGSSDFSIITFHQRLSLKSAHNKSR